jgi:predicted nucleic-acid-binding Zn-ribbon protein
MPCKSCGSENLRKFTGEIAIHFSGLKNINEPQVWVFPELVVCLNCGFAEFTVPETELRLLAKRRVAGAE